MKNKESLLVAAAVGLNMALHFITLGKWSVWHDEGFTAMLISYDTGELLERTARDVHPPLYYLLLKGWAAVFGGGDIALRSMSVMFTAMTVVATYYLVKKLFSKAVAYWTLPFLAVGPFMIRYGQEMRMYTMAMFLVTLASYAFVKLLDKSSKKSVWSFVYVVSLVLALYTQYYAGLVLFVHAFYILFTQISFSRKQWWIPSRLFKHILAIPRQWWLRWLAIGALFTPWLPTLYRQASEIQGAFWIRPVSHESFYSTLTNLLFFHESHSLDGWFAVAGMVAVGSWAIIIWKVMRTEKRVRKPLVFLASYVAVPAVVLFLLSLPLQPTYFDRYFALFANGFYALLGAAVYYVYKRQYWKTYSRLALCGVVSIALLVGVWRVATIGDFDGDRNRYTMREVSGFLNNNFHPGDMIIADDLWVFFDARFYNEAPTPVQVYIPYEVSGWGNTSLVQGRTDILIENLQDVSYGSRVWYIAQSVQDASSLPASWVDTGVSFEKGYAKVTNYIVN